MGVIQTVTSSATFTASFMRSPGRVSCAQCRKRRAGFRIAFGVLGQPLTVPAYLCAECMGIRNVDEPTEVSAPAESQPTVWDGVYENPA